ncbi:MAG TPA: heavy-metal-associated domain-containing protein [Candidatus Avalokitesvara rifleensis]|uniref:heavy-metal-associated domain-containing protein n=1 Tax=Candidatus Avalokitesvara rifleensis TaxID=3367620 RepID=UPI0027144721|nr:heavy-metal-associated domain-containing protein [Candidatus Brocadiales bacterium]
MGRAISSLTQYEQSKLCHYNNMGCSVSDRDSSVVSLPQNDINCAEYFGVLSRYSETTEIKSRRYLKMKSTRSPISVFFIISLILFSPPYLFAQVERVELTVSGMVCNLCAYGVEKNLKRQKGVETLINKQEEQLITVTAKKGESLDVRKLVKAVQDSELGVEELRAVVTGRLTDWEDKLALEEGVNEEVFLLERLKDLEEIKGKEVRLTGTVHALQGENPPHFKVESFEFISAK